MKNLSRIVDSEAEALRLQADSERNTELITTMELMKTNNFKIENLPCYYLPFGSDERFFKREDILQNVEAALDLIEGAFGCKIFALYSMGRPR